MNIDELHSGNSAMSTFGNEAVDDQQTEAIQVQKQELAELLPSVQHIIDACDDEIDAISDIRAYMKSLGDKPNVLEVQAEYRARELYIGYLGRLKDGIADRVANAEASIDK